MKIINPGALKAARRAHCEYCGKAGDTQAHHLFRRGAGGGRRLDVPFALVALDYLCHHNHHHDKEPTTADLLAIVAARHQCLQDDVVAAVRFLVSLPRAPWASDLEGVRGLSQGAQRLVRGVLEGMGMLE